MVNAFEKLPRPKKQFHLEPLSIFYEPGVRLRQSGRSKFWIGEHLLNVRVPALPFSKEIFPASEALFCKTMAGSSTPHLETMPPHYRIVRLSS